MSRARLDLVFDFSVVVCQCRSVLPSLEPLCGCRTLTFVCRSSLCCVSVSSECVFILFDIPADVSFSLLF